MSGLDNTCSACPQKMVEIQRDLRLSAEHNTSKSWTPDGLGTDALVCSGLEFIPLKVSRLNTQGSGQREGALN